MTSLLKNLKFLKKERGLELDFNLTQFLKCGAVISTIRGTLRLFWKRGVRSTRLSPVSPSFYQNEFFLQTYSPWISFDCSCELEIDDFLSYLEPASCEVQCNWSLHSLEKYQEIFARLSLAIENKSLKKAVPYIFDLATTKMEEKRLKHALFKAACSLKEKKGYLYGQWDQTGGRLGLTPELLFSKSNSFPNRVKTMALAGTFLEEDSCYLEKERKEHQYVIDGIFEAAKKVGKVEAEETRILSFGKLFHFSTPITIEFERLFSFGEIVAMLHPTPALGAYPFLEGKKWLKEVAVQIPRGYFGGPVGYHDPEKGESACYVAIRCCEWNEEGMRIGAGGGVTLESDMESEIEELKWKIASTKETLGL